MKPYSLPKGFTKFLLISLLAHVIIIALVSRFSMHPPQEQKSEIKPIKSYLYHPPKKTEAPTVDEVASQPEARPEPVQEKTETKEKPAEKPVEKEIPPPELAVETDINTITQPPSVNPMFDKKSVITNNNGQQKAINPYKALQKLSENQTEKMIADETAEKFGKKSFSVMDGEPELVPERKLVKKPTKEERTSGASAFSSVTKNDNGTCTLNQDLSHMGAGEWKATQSFACGESKQDKAYRLHMEKVLNKFVKKKTKEEDDTTPPLR